MAAGRRSVGGDHISAAEDFFKTVQRRYEAFNDDLVINNEPAIGVIECYTPAGEQIRVAEILLRRGTGTLLFVGVDRNNNACDVIAQPPSIQVFIRKLSSLDEPEREERRPVGFSVEPQEDRPPE